MSTTMDDFPDFVRFAEQTAPPHLQVSAPPTNWPGTAEQWATLLAEARDKHRRDSAAIVVERIAQGWTMAELLVGQLERGAMVGSDGHVVRIERRADAGLRQRAQTVLNTIQREMLWGLLDPISQVNIEQISAGKGDFQGVAAHVDAAENAIRSAVAQRETARALARDEHSITIDVHYDFRGVGGRTWQAGQHHVSASELEGLNAWAAAARRQAKERAWPDPLGFENRPFPPFTVLEAATA